MSGQDNPQSTTVDAFLDGRLMLEQPAGGYRAGLDAILLAAACPMKPAATGRVLDCGAGVGAVGLAIAIRLEQAEAVLIERDAGTAALARRNAARNGLSGRTRVVEADLTVPLSEHSDLAGMAGTFDHVLANPPYFADDAGTRARDGQRRGAHSMSAGSLDRWIRFAAAMARGGGSLTLIHRTESLGEILTALENRFGAVRILPIQATASDKARRVIVSAVKGSRAPLTLLPALVVHGQDGAKYSPAVEDIVRGRAALVWSGSP